MRHNTSSPSACQKVMSGQPKSGGSSQIHRANTTAPPMALNTNIPTSASGAIQISLFLMFSPSRLREFVVDALQPLAQIQHRIAFAREQRVHVHAGLRRHLLEASPFKLKHATANEVTQTGLLPLEHFGDMVVLFEWHLSNLAAPFT